MKHFLSPLAPIASFCVMITLAGCFATTPTTPDSKVVEVPIPVKCEPVYVDKPILSLKGSSPQMSLFEKLKRALSDREELIAYTKKLEVASTKCVKPSN